LPSNDVIDHSVLIKNALHSKERGQPKIKSKSRKNMGLGL